MLKPVYQHIYQGDLPPKAGYQPVAIGSARLYMNPPISNRVYRLISISGKPCYVVVWSGFRRNDISVLAENNARIILEYRGGVIVGHGRADITEAKGPELVLAKAIRAACLMRGELVGVNLELSARSIYSGGF